MAAAMIWCPFADEESAASAAGILLDEELVACANILPPMRSLYRWDGKRGEGRETGVLFKTDGDRRDAAMARLAEVHPYDEPAIMSWACDAAPGTAQWLARAGA
ncbi:divalent ion tolerance protein CutA [Blastomonas marina]|uniref:Divalent ion tolerance protein CutA n=2 Tax=Blastomonas marina TaxID=1867408 RepID=A0ABQ1FH69_9SPHN|nr:divalent ion tolerance protein CutA [Blastomonas marina]